MSRWYRITILFFVKQKTAYEMRISDWSSDVCSSDLGTVVLTMQKPYAPLLALMSELWILSPKSEGWADTVKLPIGRSEEHTSELQSLMRISYAVFCLKKKNTQTNQYHTTPHKLPPIMDTSNPYTNITKTPKQKPP